MRAVPLPPRRVVLVALAVAVAVPVLGAPSPAAADDPVPGDTVVGELVQGYADPGPDEAAAAEPGQADPGLLSWIETAPGEAVRVPTEDLGEATAGDTVEVTVGGEVRDAATDAGLEPALEVSAAEVVREAATPVAPAGSPVNHQVTVVMLQPANAARDTATLAGVTAAVNGPVADFWSEQTDGAVRFGAVAGFDWTTQSALTCADPVALWNEAAVRAGWTSGPGKHLLVYLPNGSPGCSYGLGSIGNGPGSGGVAYVRDPELSVIAHEFGHNLGLGHSSQLQCDGVVDTGTCGISDYFDLYDVMGMSWDEVGSLNAPHAALLGVQPSGSAVTVAAGGPATEVVLAPVGARTGTRAVRLTEPDGDVYWLEYRTATGRDAWLGTGANWPGLQAGVLLRQAVDDGGDTSWLLDGTPSGQSQWADDLTVALPGSASVTFGSTPFTVQVLQATGTGARVLVSPGPGVHPMDAAYPRLAATLGTPTTGRACGLRAGGCYQLFQRGAMYWSPATGAKAVVGAIGARWAAQGWETGPLGYPVSDETCGLRGGGCFQQFQGGSVHFTPATGAQATWGAIRDRWAAQGWETGLLGYPVSGEICGLRGGGCFQQFQGGSVHWSPGTGAQATWGAVRARWAAHGWETGPLGYPVSGEICGLRGGGCYQQFQGGSVHFTPATGAQATWGAIRDRWAAWGWETGLLGYPVTGEVCGLRAGGCYQVFQGGSVYWSPATGAWVVWGTVRDRWAAQGWEAGRFGYPLRDPVCETGGWANYGGGGACRQDFQGGVLDSFWHG